jgi:hypothetical protein
MTKAISTGVMPMNSDSRAPYHQAREHVAAELVGAQRMPRRADRLAAA